MENFEVSLVKEACLACGTLMDGPIVMNSVLTDKYAKEVKDLHGKCIGYAEELCPKCKELCAKGLLIIEIDESKSESNNTYRTGHLWVISNNSDFGKHLLKSNYVINKNGCKFIFIDYNTTRELGFYNN